MTATKRSNVRYSTHELALLNQHYKEASRETLLSLFPGRTWKALNMQAQRMGLADRPFAIRYNTWSAGSEALLREHYPAKGARFVAALLGRSKKSVTTKAGALGIKHIRPPKAEKLPKPPRPPKPPKVKAAPTPKPPKPAPAPKPVKQPKVKASSPRLVNHATQKALKERSEKARNCDVVFTADEIRRRPITDPIRQAYQSNGDRGVRAYLQTLNAAA